MNSTTKKVFFDTTDLIDLNKLSSSSKFLIKITLVVKIPDKTKKIKTDKFEITSVIKDIKI